MFTRDNQCGSESETTSCVSPSIVGCRNRLGTSMAQRSSPSLPHFDRFVPNRSLINLDASSELLDKHRSPVWYSELEQTPQTLQTKVLNLSGKFQLINYHRSNGKVTNVSENSELTSEASLARQSFFNTAYVHKYYSRVKSRHDVMNPCQSVTLDAYDATIDFYTNLLDWSSKDLLAVGLTDRVVVQNVHQNQTVKFFSLTNPDNETTLTTSVQDRITSLKWTPDGNRLAIGTLNNHLLLWDVSSGKCISKLDYAMGSSVTSMAWNKPMAGGNFLSTGSKKGDVLHFDMRDLRKRTPVQGARLDTFEDTVCNLKWNENGRFLASGMNSGRVAVWDFSYPKVNPNTLLMMPFRLLEFHKAGVKALDWNPWQQNILATGGGRQDGILAITNVIKSESPIYEMDLGTQLSSVIWSRNNPNELLSSHGIPRDQLAPNISNLADRNLILWDYPSMQCIGLTNKHPGSIVDTALSPNGEDVVSLGAEKTIRLFKCFSKARSKPRVDSFRLHNIR